MKVCIKTKTTQIIDKTKHKLLNPQQKCLDRTIGSFGLNINMFFETDNNVFVFVCISKSFTVLFSPRTKQGVLLEKCHLKNSVHRVLKV